MTWRVARFDICGVKGVLDAGGEILLESGKNCKSMAVFAPNGCGKSGYADAVEYFFSRDGAVEHLGRGPADSEKGGKHALHHVLAKERSVTPTVSALLVNDETGERLPVVRPVLTGRNDNLPAALAPLLDVAPAHRVLRQHDLRKFVVELEPNAKYAELSRWLNIDGVRDLLGHLKTAENQLSKLGPRREVEERLRDLKKETQGAIDSHDEAALFKWCTEQYRLALGSSREVQSLGQLRESVAELIAARDTLIQSAAATGLMSSRERAREHLATLLGPPGSVALAVDAITAADVALELLERMRLQSQHAVFHELWTAASSTLAATGPAECPVCGTTWKDTPRESLAAATQFLTESLEKLENLKRADAAHALASAKAKSAVTSCVGSLNGLSMLLEELGLLQPSKDVKGQADALPILYAKRNTSQESREELTGEFQKIREGLNNGVREAMAEMHIAGVPPQAKALDDLSARWRVIDQCVVRLRELARLTTEYRKVEESFSALTTAIQSRAAHFVREYVGLLRADIERLFGKLHPDAKIPNIHIEPDIETRSLSLRVDFHVEGRTLPPAGYLSESQINSLGLAIFLSTVRLFNKKFPFVFLDDIVSSYDAEHRSYIVDVIAEELEECQVLLTTHDERFFQMLRGRLDGQQWCFERVKHWDIASGPRREGDLTKDEEIVAALKDGDEKVAGNAVRQAMEEWLDKMCDKYQAHTPHRRGPKEFERTLWDYWQPFAKRVTKLGSGFGDHVSRSSCFQKLKGHSLINYYSHSQSNPYTWGSVGDVKYIFDEFRLFRDLFHCDACKKQLAYDPSNASVYCTCGKAIRTATAS
jgi:hypothetical protein